ncbi:MAG: metal ABC transporter substrate-binding protein [Planctomycetota bacterium]
MTPRAPEILLLLIAMAVISCRRQDAIPTVSSEKPAQPVVYTVNYPLQYMAQRIGTGIVTVEFPAPADGDPAFWSPKPETILAFQSADLVLLNGAGYAKWVERVTLPQSRLVDTSRSFEKAYIAIPDSITHGHGPQGKHSHAGIEFTTWLDPSQAIDQARAIQAAFARLSPEQQQVFQENFRTLERDLLLLDKSLAEIVARDPQKPLLASHPVYQYLARRYSLNLRSVHWEPEKMPAAPEWQELQEMLTPHPARWMLWEGVPREETVLKLRALGIESIVYSPCATVPKQGDFLSVMEQNLKNLKAAFSK